MAKKKILKIALISALIGLLALIALFVTLYTFTPVVDKAVLATVNRLASGSVTLDYSNLSGNLFRQIRMEDVVLDFGGDSLEVEQIDLDYDLLDVIGGNFQINDLSIDQAVLKLDLGREKSEADTLPFSLDSLLVKANPGILPQIKIDQLRLRDGKILLKNGPQTEVIDQVALSLSGRANSDTVNISPVKLSARWQERNLDLLKVHFDLVGNENALLLENFNIESDPQNFASGSAGINFAEETQLFANLDNVQLQADFLNKVVADFPFQKGQLSLKSNLRGNDQGFAGDFSLNGEMDDLRLRRLSANYTFADEKIDIQKIQLASNVGNLAGTLRIAGEGENHIRAKIDQVDLQAAKFTADPLLLNGEIDLNFRGWSLESFSGSGKLNLVDILVGPARIDTVRVGIKTRGQNIIIAENSKIQIAPGSEFQVGGYIAKDLTAELTLNTEDNVLDSLAARLGLNNAGGSGQLDLL